MAHLEHDPEPEFVSRLEDQLTHEFRRRERLGLHDRPRREFRRVARTAGFVVAGILLGVASVTTAQRVEEAGRSELLLRQAEANASVAAARAAAYREQAQRAEEQWEAGTLSLIELFPTRAEVIEAELQQSLAELDVEAIRAGGRPVRDEISASRVNGRDFVSERLQRELGAITQRMAQVEALVEFYEARVRAGVATDDALVSPRMEQLQLEARERQHGEALALRETFLEGAIDAEAAELNYRLLEATTRRQVAEARLESRRAADQMVQRRVAAGIAPTSDAAVSQHELLRAETESQIARMEVELIEAELRALAEDGA